MWWACWALYHITFFGTQPTLTQVPPNGPFSTTAACTPYSAAFCACARPPLPPPSTSKSNLTVTVYPFVASAAHLHPDGRQVTRAEPVFACDNILRVYGSQT